MMGVHLVVSGQVQGVGFRAFVRRTALELSVRGKVWNTKKGDVEIFAAHESATALAQFELRLMDGPGHVTNIDRTDRWITLVGPGFEVSPTI